MCAVAPTRRATASRPAHARYDWRMSVKQERQAAGKELSVTLGLHVDKWQGPHPDTSLGRVTLGRAAFLAMLETWLGLSGPPVSIAERTATFLLALRKVDGPGRFFHDSLAADEVGAAARLLQWRDEWILGGWTGAAPAGGPPRLADMAAVEQIAARLLPAGEGERLSAVLRRLDERRVPLSEIILLEDQQLFPALWRRVLGRFTLRDGSPPLPSAASSTQLGRLQSAVVSVISTPDEFDSLPDLNGDDGTITVVRPQSFETAEHWLAHHYHASLVKPLLVSEQHGPSVDDTLRVHGVPACGFGESSTLRPALQTLPLCFETFWTPLEPARLLDFLMHPIGPFAASARRAFATAFAERPGIGGPEWLRVREQVLAAASDDGRPALAQRIQFWLESPRHTRAAGAPIDYAIERVDALGQALRHRLRHLDAQETVARDLGAAVSQCAAVLGSLKSLQRDGVSFVRPRLLEQLCSQATTNGSNNLAVAEAGCMVSAIAPEACALGPASEVVWWMPAAPRLPAQHPWSRAELDALARAGVELVDPARAMDSLASLWMRPLLTASERLILVLPPAPAEDHPAWQLVTMLAPRLPVRSLEAHPMMRDKLLPVASAPLPRASGLWELDTAATWRAAYPAPTRLSSQSYTSMDLHFNNPAIAVLKYAARLRAGRTMSVAKDNRLFGNLAHQLVERLFGNSGALTWGERELAEWLEPELDSVLQQEGMPLLAPGNSIRLSQFKDTVRYALRALLRHLAHAGVTRVEPERPLRGQLGALHINGAADLLLHLADGQTAALDLKWSGATRYRKALAEGRFLQLALYADMIRQELGKPPAAIGYFTFREAMLLTTTPDLFGSDARVIQPGNEVNSAHLVMQARASWDWRVGQWREGRIDVIARGLDPEPAPPPQDCLPLGETAPWHGEFTALFGNRE